MAGTNWAIYGTVRGFRPKSGCLKVIHGTNKAKHGTDSGLQPDFEDKQNNPQKETGNRKR
jgi:hypothetical protein